MKFDIELVGKVGSMALVNKKWGDIDYNAIARISRELRPGYIWVTSGATEIGRIDYIRRNGREIEGDYNDVKTDYAAQGQIILMDNYRQYIDPKYSVRQILVEHRRQPQKTAFEMSRAKGYSYYQLQRPPLFRGNRQDRTSGACKVQRRYRALYGQ